MKSEIYEKNPILALYLPYLYLIFTYENIICSLKIQSNLYGPINGKKVICSLGHINGVFMWYIINFKWTIDKELI